ncbi:hypothetical protein HK101_007967 [Irineochytrium annulatum]|nr:hypothetical protein HK101_007967 [Irineochytrium annulatum]
MDFANSFDLDLFHVPSPKAKRSTRPQDYTARWVHEGWVLDKPQSFEAQFDTKMGPNELLSGIERLYLLRRYSDALPLARRWIACNARRRKPILHHEIYDLASRCAWRLGDINEALTLLQPAIEMSHDPGILFFHSKLLALKGSQEDAVRGFRRYLELRTTDYMAWKEIAAALLACARSRDGEQARLAEYLASRAMMRALRRLTRSPREDNEISKLHESTEMAEMRGFVALHDRDAGDRLFTSEDVHGLFEEDVAAFLFEFLAVDINDDGADDVGEDIAVLAL